MLRVLWRKLLHPQDAASLAAFRILFGLLMTGSMLRFWFYGWIDRFYVKPQFFFKYWGFSWIEVWPEWGMYLHFAVLTVAALCITAGFLTRFACIVFFLGFTYLELMDASNYLNHYYLVSILSFLLCFLPLGGYWSVDAWIRPRIKKEMIPAWPIYLLRFQIAVVYFYAGMAKLTTDWLLNAQPMNIWMTARIDLPLIGQFLDLVPVHYFLSWAGFIYDTFVVVFLLIPQTRIFAALTACLFHFLTLTFFPIGMFPFIMLVAVTVFFGFSWPRNLLRRPLPVTRNAQKPVQNLKLSGTRKAWVGAFALYACLQVFIPLRHLLYPGDVLWNEEGMRFSWKVMVREKNGSITYFVNEKNKPKVWQISPSRYLNSDQEREMASQPEMIHQLARHIKNDFEKRGFQDIEVRVRALVSLNGRPAQLLIDPEINLAAQPDDLWPKPWILPEPRNKPILIGANRPRHPEQSEGSFTSFRMTE